MPTSPFKLTHDRRQHIPKQKRKVTNWREHDASLTALTLRTVFRLAYRQAKDLLSAIVGLLGLAPRVPDPPH